MTDNKFPDDDNYVTVNRKAPKVKLKRAEKDPATIEFERARDKWKAETIEEMSKEEAKIATKYQVNPLDIDYVDNYNSADTAARAFLKIAEKSKGIHPFGIDFEGDFDTMQLYTEEHGRKKLAVVFQLNKITRNGLLPPSIIRFITHENTALEGKNTEKELLVFLEKFKVSNRDAAKVKYLDILTIFRYCDTMSRGDHFATAHFCDSQDYKPNPDRILDELDTPIEDYGAAFCHKTFIKGEFLEKPPDLRNPNLHDWSLTRKDSRNKGRMTDRMLIYAESDPGSAFEVCDKSAKLSGCRVQNFTQLLRPDPSIGNPKPFLDGALAKYHRRVAKGEIQESQADKEKREKMATLIKDSCEAESNKRATRFEINKRKKIDWCEKHQPERLQEEAFQQQKKPTLLSTSGPTMEEQRRESIAFAASRPISDAPVRTSFNVFHPPEQRPTRTLDDAMAELYKNETPQQRQARIEKDNRRALEREKEREWDRKKAEEAAESERLEKEEKERERLENERKEKEREEEKERERLERERKEKEREEREEREKSERERKEKKREEEKEKERKEKEREDELSVSADPNDDVDDDIIDGGIAVNNAAAAATQDDGADDINATSAPAAPLAEETTNEVVMESPPITPTNSRQPDAPTTAAAAAAGAIPDAWRDQVRFYNRKPLQESATAIARLVKHNNGNQLLNNLVFIAENLENKGKQRQIITLMRNALPPITRDFFVIRIIHSKIIHESYLHSLNILSHYTLHGEIIVDQLRVGKSTTALGIYLAASPVQEVEHAINLLAAIADKTPTQTRSFLQTSELFPDNYLMEDDITTILSPKEIVNLANLLCSTKDIAIPEKIRTLHMREFFSFLSREFQGQRINVDDFIHIALETVYRLRVNPQEAVDALEKERQHAISHYLAFKFDTKKPTPNPPEWIPPQPCYAHDRETEEATKDITRYMIIDRYSRLKMAELVKKEATITILRHEPPSLFPSKEKIDMISILAGDCAFHILMQTKKEEVTKAIKALKDATTGCEIFGHDCRALVEFLEEEFDWSPTIHDVMPYARHIVANGEPSLNDIARFAFGGRICFNSSIFSAHITPSTDALRHREQKITAIKLFARRFYGNIIPDQQRQPQEDWDLELEEEEESRSTNATATTPPRRIRVEPESRLRSPVRTSKRFFTRHGSPSVDAGHRKVQRRDDRGDHYEPMMEQPPRNDARTASHSRTRPPLDRSDQQPSTSRASSASTTAGIEYRRRRSPSPRHRRDRSHSRGRDSERKSTIDSGRRRDDRDANTRRHRPVSREDARR